MVLRATLHHLHDARWYEHPHFAPELHQLLSDVCHSYILHYFLLIIFLAFLDSLIDQCCHSVCQALSILLECIKSLLLLLKFTLLLMMYIALVVQLDF